MADEQKLATMYVEVKAKTDELQKELEELKRKVKRDAPKINFDTSIGKLKLDQLKAYHAKLKSVLENKIKLNADVSSLSRTQSQITSIERKLKETGTTAVETGDKLSRWATLTTGINQGFELVRNTVALLKQEIGNSVTSANNLSVLRDNFKGTADDIELFRTAVAGTVSEAGLIKLSNQATDLGISLEQQAILFSLAEDAADKYGTSTEEGFSKIIAASEGSIKGVKAIGIETKKYQERVDELAKAQGDSINNLDAETQKQIRLQAIIELSGVTLDDVKKKVKDNADQYESLSVQVEEAKIKLGNMISEALLPLIKNFNDSSKGAKDFTTFILAIGGTVIDLIPLIANLALITRSFGTASVTAGAGVDVATGALTRFNIAAKGSLLWKLLGVGAVGVGAGVLIGKGIDALKDNNTAPFSNPSGVFRPGEIFQPNVQGTDLLQTDKPDLSFLNKDNKTFIGKDGKPQTVKVKVEVVDDSDYKKRLNEIENETTKKLNDLKKVQGKTDKEKEIASVQIKKEGNEKKYQLDVEYGFKTNKEQIKNEKELSDEKQKIYRDFYKTIGNYSKNYGKVREAEIDEEVNKLREAGVEEVDIAKYVFDEKQKIKNKEIRDTTDIEKAKLDANQREYNTYLRSAQYKRDLDAGLSTTYEAFIQRRPDLYKSDFDSYKSFVDKKLEQDKRLGKAPTKMVEDIINTKKTPEQIERERVQREMVGIDLLLNPSTATKAKEDAMKFMKPIEGVPERGNEIIDPAKQFEEAMQKGNESANNTAEQFSAILNMGASLTNILNIGADTFVGKLLSGLDQANSLANSISGLISAFGGGPAGGVFSFITGLFGHTGGTFQNGAKISNIPQFATGGSFIVPPGFPNDTFPLLVESGERVSVTPSNQVSSGTGDIGLLAGKLDAVNKNLAGVQSEIKSIKLQVNIDGKSLVKNTTKPAENKLNKTGINLDAL